MCVSVFATCSHEGETHPPASCLRIIHFEEAICNKPEKGHVEILATLLVEVREVDVFMHLVHRRWVEMWDATDTILAPTTPFEEALARISPITHVPTEGSCEDFTWRPPVVPDSGIAEYLCDEQTSARLAHIDSSATDVGGGLRLTDVDRRATPYTSVRFGPFAPQQMPYIFRARLRITEPTFSHLIRSVNQYGVQYHYGIEGPDIVWKDIEELDFRGLSEGEVEPFRKLYHQVQNLNAVAPIQSYTVLTFDIAESRTAYNRAYAWTERIVDAQIETSGGRSYRVNGWHSTNTRFVLQRVAFR